MARLGRKAVVAFFVLGAAASMSADPLPDPDTFLEIDEIRVALHPPPGGNDALTLRARFGMDAASFDPTSDRVRIDIGASSSFELAPGARGVRVRGGVVRFRRPARRSGETPGPLRSMVLDLSKSRIRARVDRAGRLGLRDESPWSVPVTLTIGAVSAGVAVDLASRGRRLVGPARPDADIQLRLRAPAGVREGPEAVEVIPDEAAWTAFWDAHRGTPAVVDPSVDFTREFLVAIVFRVASPRGLTMDGVETRADKLVLHCTFLEPLCLVPAVDLGWDVRFARLPVTALPVELDVRDRWWDCSRPSARK